MYDEAHIRDWIRRLAVLRPELGGFAVCPYASGASFKIIECPVNDIEVSLTGLMSLFLWLSVN